MLLGQSIIATKKKRKKRNFFSERNVIDLLLYSSPAVPYFRNLRGNFWSLNNILGSSLLHLPYIFPKACKNIVHYRMLQRAGLCFIWDIWSWKDLSKWNLLLIYVGLYCCIFSQICFHVLRQLYWWPMTLCTYTIKRLVTK